MVPRVGMDLCHSVSQEILCFQWHVYFHYLASSLPQIPVQIQINSSTLLYISVTPSLKLALSFARFFIFLPAHPVCYHHHHHHHHVSFMELGHLLTRSGLTYPEVSSKVYHDSVCQLGSSISLPWVICPASFRETCLWLKFPLNGLPAQSRVNPVVGLLPLASGPACLGMAFPPFLVKQFYRCDSVVISSFVRTGYTTRR